MEPNQTTNPMNPVSPDPTPAPVVGGEHKKVGPIIASLIIVLVLVIAALYLFASHISQPDNTAATMTNTDAATTTSVNASTSTEVQPVTNTADDPQSLQNDLNASTNGLDNQNF